MIISRLLTAILLTVLHTMTNSLNEYSVIPQDSINVNVGKRVRMECELNNSTINGNIKGLWLRLEDTEIFFYSTSRIYSDQRFQIEQRPILHIINSTLSHEIIIYSLIIDDVRLSDHGTYSCQADNKIIKLFLLNIVERPYFVTHEYTTLVRTQIGKNLSISCEALGKPNPSVSWIKKIDETHQKLMTNCSTTPTTCQMDLFDVNHWHHGIYECVAMNSVGTIGRFYELDVQFPPDVYTPRIKSSHSIGDPVILECFIDANPEPDIRWLHQFPDNIKEEMDLSRQFYQGFDDNNNNRRDSGIWSIKQEQLNATRWKISLFIKHFPKRLFNTNFICRAVNRHGKNEQSITILQSYHSSKKHRQTTLLTYTSTLPYNQSQLSSTTQFLSEETYDINNQSRRISSYYLFLLGLSFFVSSLIIQ